MCSQMNLIMLTHAQIRTCNQLNAYFYFYNNYMSFKLSARNQNIGPFWNYFLIQFRVWMLPVTEIEPSFVLRRKTISPDAGEYSVKAEILTWWLTRTVGVSKGAFWSHCIVCSVRVFSWSKFSKNKLRGGNSEISPRSNSLAVSKHLHDWLEYTTALPILFIRMRSQIFFIGNVLCDSRHAVFCNL